MNQKKILTISFAFTAIFLSFFLISEASGEQFLDQPQSLIIEKPDNWAINDDEPGIVILTAKTGNPGEIQAGPVTLANFSAGAQVELEMFPFAPENFTINATKADIKINDEEINDTRNIFVAINGTEFTSLEFNTNKTQEFMFAFEKANLTFETSKNSHVKLEMEPRTVKGRNLIINKFGKIEGPFSATLDEEMAPKSITLPSRSIFTDILNDFSLASETDLLEIYLYPASVSTPGKVSIERKNDGAFINLNGNIKLTRGQSLNFIREDDKIRLLIPAKKISFAPSHTPLNIAYPASPNETRYVAINKEGRMVYETELKEKNPNIVAISDQKQAKENFENEASKYKSPSQRIADLKAEANKGGQTLLFFNEDIEKLQGIVDADGVLSKEQQEKLIALKKGADKLNAKIASTSEKINGVMAERKSHYDDMISPLKELEANYNAAGDSATAKEIQKNIADIEDLYSLEQVEMLISAGNSKDAIKIAENLEKNPKLKDQALFYKGNALLSTGAINEANIEWNKITDKNIQEAAAGTSKAISIYQLDKLTSELEDEAKKIGGDIAEMEKPTLYKKTWRKLKLEEWMPDKPYSEVKSMLKNNEKSGIAAKHDGILLIRDLFGRGLSFDEIQKVERASEVKNLFPDYTDEEAAHAFIALKYALDDPEVDTVIKQEKGTFTKDEQVQVYINKAIQARNDEQGAEKALSWLTLASKIDPEKAREAAKSIPGMTSLKYQAFADKYGDIAIDILGDPLTYVPAGTGALKLTTQLAASGLSKIPKAASVIEKLGQLDGTIRASQAAQKATGLVESLSKSTPTFSAIGEKAGEKIAAAASKVATKRGAKWLFKPISQPVQAYEMGKAQVMAEKLFTGKSALWGVADDGKPVIVLQRTADEIRANPLYKVEATEITPTMELPEKNGFATGGSFKSTLGDGYFVDVQMSEPTAEAFESAVKAVLPTHVTSPITVSAPEASAPSLRAGAIKDDFSAKPLLTEAEAEEATLVDKLAQEIGVPNIVYAGRQKLSMPLARAITNPTSTANEIVLSSEWQLPRLEEERVIVHEIRHAATVELDKKGIEYYKIMHTDEFKELQGRIGQAYDKAAASGAEFAKTKEVYQSPDETLSLLQGYKKWRGQGMPEGTQPYEFTKAFEAADLKWIDDEGFLTSMVEKGSKLAPSPEPMEKILITEESLLKEGTAPLATVGDRFSAEGASKTTGTGFFERIKAKKEFKNSVDAAATEYKELTTEHVKLYDDALKEGVKEKQKALYAEADLIADKEKGVRKGILDLFEQKGFKANGAEFDKEGNRLISMDNGYIFRQKYNKDYESFEDSLELLDMKMSAAKKNTWGGQIFEMRMNDQPQFAGKLFDEAYSYEMAGYPDFFDASKAVKATSEKEKLRLMENYKRTPEEAASQAFYQERQILDFYKNEWPELDPSLKQSLEEENVINFLRYRSHDGKKAYINALKEADPATKAFLLSGETLELGPADEKYLKILTGKTTPPEVREFLKDNLADLRYFGESGIYYKGLENPETQKILANPNMLKLSEDNENLLKSIAENGLDAETKSLLSNDLINTLGNIEDIDRFGTKKGIKDYLDIILSSDPAMQEPRRFLASKELLNLLNTLSKDAVSRDEGKILENAIKISEEGFRRDALISSASEILENPHNQIKFINVIASEDASIVTTLEKIMPKVSKYEYYDSKALMKLIKEPDLLEIQGELEKMGAYTSDIDALANLKDMKAVETIKGIEGKLGHEIKIKSIDDLNEKSLILISKDETISFIKELEKIGYKFQFSYGDFYGIKDLMSSATTKEKFLGKLDFIKKLQSELGYEFHIEDAALILDVSEQPGTINLLKEVEKLGYKVRFIREDVYCINDLMSSAAKKEEFLGKIDLIKKLQSELGYEFHIEDAALILDASKQPSFIKQLFSIEHKLDKNSLLYLLRNSKELLQADIDVSKFADLMPTITFLKTEEIKKIAPFINSPIDTEQKKAILELAPIFKGENLDLAQITSSDKAKKSLDVIRNKVAIDLENKIGIKPSEEYTLLLWKLDQEGSLNNAGELNGIKRMIELEKTGKLPCYPFACDQLLAGPIPVKPGAGTVGVDPRMSYGDYVETLTLAMVGSKDPATAAKYLNDAKRIFDSQTIDKAKEIFPTINLKFKDLAPYLDGGKVKDEESAKKIIELFRSKITKKDNPLRLLVDQTESTFAPDKDFDYVAVKTFNRKIPDLFGSDRISACYFYPAGGEKAIGYVLDPYSVFIDLVPITAGQEGQPIARAMSFLARTKENEVILVVDSVESGELASGVKSDAWRELMLDGIENLAREKGIKKILFFGRWNGEEWSSPCNYNPKRFLSWLKDEKNAPVLEKGLELTKVGDPKPVLEYAPGFYSEVGIPLKGEKPKLVQGILMEVAPLEVKLPKAASEVITVPEDTRTLILAQIKDSLPAPPEKAVKILWQYTSGEITKEQAQNSLAEIGIEADKASKAISSLMAGRSQ